MDPQLTVVVVTIVLAAAYLIRRSWRVLGGTKKGCAGGCGCATNPAVPTATRQPNLLNIGQSRIGVRHPDAPDDPINA